MPRLTRGLLERLSFGGFWSQLKQLISRFNEINSKMMRKMINAEIIFVIFVNLILIRIIVGN